MDYGGYVKKVTADVLKTTNRSKYLKQAQKYGYAELPEFMGKEDWEGHFNCASCEYFREDEKSPTGYWCEAIDIPDEPWGCCDLYDLRPDLRAFNQSKSKNKDIGDRK